MNEWVMKWMNKWVSKKGPVTDTMERQLYIDSSRNGHHIVRLLPVDAIECPRSLIKGRETDLLWKTKSLDDPSKHSAIETHTCREITTHAVVNSSHSKTPSSALLSPSTVSSSSVGHSGRPPTKGRHEWPWDRVSQHLIGTYGQFISGGQNVVAKT